MNSKTHQNLRRSVITALFAALITVMTAYICHIPYGVNGGYIHFGDALIFLAAAILPTPYAIGAAAIGGGLADLLTSPLWAPFTIIIKSAMALIITHKNEKIICKKNMFMLIACAAITIGGYFLAGIAVAVISGSDFSAGFVASALSIWGNVVQSAGSSVIFIIIGVALDKSGFKKRCNNALA